MNSKEYDVFDGRYRVVVGVRGGITVYSNVSNNQHKPMRVYGRDKKGLRYVNLTSVKGGVAEGYSLDALKDFVTGISEDLKPLSEEEIINILKASKPPALLNTPEEIESLPTHNTLNNYTTSYMEEVEGFTRYYTRCNFTNATSGYLKFNYRVTTHCSLSNITTTSKTDTFTDKRKIVINELEDISDSELESIFQQINNERIHRKLLEFPGYSLKGMSSEEASRIMYERERFNPDNKR